VPVDLVEVRKTVGVTGYSTGSGGGDGDGIDDGPTGKYCGDSGGGTVVGKN